jgi:UDP-N-acetylmuramoyl-tripeptide--D-alanyl-D-alanine ligase
MEWTIAEIVEVTGGTLVKGSGSKTVSLFSTDSRTAPPGSLFVPLEGPRFNGHQFIESAFRSGSVATLVKKGCGANGAGIAIEVADPLRAMQALAAETRRRFQGPVVGITGSNGKTTTKEMLGAILSMNGPILKTEGNLNNHIGVPLTLLSLKKGDRLILLELGINHPGELRTLCEISRPTHGIITSIGESHLEGLGSLEGVADAKGELLDFLAGGTAFLNRDSPFYDRLAKRQKGKTVSFGLDLRSDVRGSDVRPGAGCVNFTLIFGKRELPVRLALSGSHHVSNALGAAAVALALGIDLQSVAEGLERFRPAPLRSEWHRLSSGVQIISDAYNANPTSMEAALRMLAELGKIDERPTVAILGDMLELGPVSDAAHYRLGKFAAALNIGRILLIGKASESVLRGALDGGQRKQDIEHFPDQQSLSSAARALLKERPLILIKGSRGMKLERTLESLLKE